MLKRIRGELGRIHRPSLKSLCKNTLFVITASITTAIILSLVNAGVTELIGLII